MGKHLLKRLDNINSTRSADLERMNNLDRKLDGAIKDTIKLKSISFYQSQSPVRSTTYSPLLLDDLLQSEALRKLIRDERELLLEANPIVFLFDFLSRCFVYDEYWRKLQKSGILTMLKRIESALPAQDPINA